jgi:ATP-binding cassette, subfamily B, bacterial MsbA
VSAFLRLLEYARPHRARLSVALAAMVAYGAGTAGVALQIQPILDNVLPNRTNLAPTIAAVLGFYLVKGVGAYVSAYLMTDVGQRVVRDLRNALFRHILGQSAAFFNAQTSGRLMSRIISDVSLVQRAVSETIGDLLRETLAVFGFLALLIYYDAYLALLCLTAAPVVVYPLVRFGQKVRRTTRRSQEAQEQMSHVSAEAFTGHRIVKAFGAEARESSRFERASHHFYRTSMKVTGALSALPPLMELLGGAAFVTALWYGSREIAAGTLTTGQFVGFLTALFMMYTPVKKLSRVNADLQQAMAAADRIFEMLDTHTEVTEQPDAIALPPVEGRVEFRDVRFSYEGSDDATLSGVSFNVGSGQMIAVVGRSGAGKTTLVNLIPRFYDASSGQVLIDGHDVRGVTLSSLRRQISVVTQETVLFDDTIAANIAYGRPDASRGDIEAAARSAHAVEFIKDLEQGYDTMIGERGQRLSGGQRQRLAIARAILRNAPILILDEATSSLDAESEMLVQDALTNLMLNRTSFVIAHRLSTVRRADAIVVLERGTIVESGSHETLLARGGAYAKLYERQFQEEPSELRT